MKPYFRTGPGMPGSTGNPGFPGPATPGTRLVKAGT
jgi:hypothetical protein